MRNPRLKFAAAMAALVLLRSLDLFLTFLYTPTLAGEWNPVVSRFNSAWTGMILVQVAVIAAVSVPMYCYFTFPKTLVDEPGLGYNQFVYFYFFKTRPQGLKRFLIRPRNFKGVMVFNGFALMWAIAGVSLFAIAHSLLLLNRCFPYERFIVAHAVPYFLTAYLIIAAVPVYAFFLREYADYRRRF
jgi:hypothetical protein